VVFFIGNFTYRGKKRGTIKLEVGTRRFERRSAGIANSSHSLKLIAPIAGAGDNSQVVRT